MQPALLAIDLSSQHIVKAIINKKTPGQKV
jgi:hypothetical protein